MHHRKFLAHVDDAAVLAAIKSAEGKTSGQIRVFISHHDIADPLAAAQLQFHRLGMHKTTARNAILLFIAPKSHQFAVYGDVAVHEKCGDDFWQSLRDQLVPHLKAAHYTAAIVGAVTAAGEKLALHFPSSAHPHNELPDDIVRD